MAVLVGEDYVKKAIALGFEALGFSGHAPVPMENSFAILPEELNDYGNAIKFLKQKYSNQIKIFLSLEIDYIPKVIEDFSIFKKQLELDYTIGSVHLVKNGSG